MEAYEFYCFDCDETYEIYGAAIINSGQRCPDCHGWDTQWVEDAPDESAV